MARIKINDTKKNIEVVYIYVNQFDWGENQLDKEQFSNHLNPGKVYRAVKNTDTNSYRVVYDDTHELPEAIYLDNFKVTDFGKYGFTCDISIISLDTILDCKIEEACLDNLLKWMEVKNADLIKKWFKQEPEKDSQNGKVARTPQQSDGMVLTPEMVQLIHVGAELEAHDPMIFGTIFDLIIHLNKALYEDTGPISTAWIQLDKEHGAGTNVTTAIQKLSTYMGPNRRTNLEDKDLMDAIRHLLVEKSRRNYHEIY